MALTLTVCTGSILRFVRDCTTLAHEGERCRTTIPQPTDAAASTDHHQQQQQQPVRSCVWTCSWDGCNDAPLSTASRRHLCSSVSLAVPLLILGVVTQSLLVADTGV